MQDIVFKKVSPGLIGLGPKDDEEKIEINKDPEEAILETKKPNDPNAIEWSAAEFTFREKTNDWYWTVGAVTVALIILSYFIKNFLFAIISIIGGFSVALFGTKKPNTLNFKVTEKGIQIENKVYLFNDIESFCINEELEYEPRLFAKMKTGFLSVLSLPIHEADIDLIKDFLKNHLKEEEIQESFTSILIRLIGV